MKDKQKFFMVWASVSQNFEGEGQMETGKRSRAAEGISSFERGQQFEGPDVSCIY